MERKDNIKFMSNPIYINSLQLGSLSFLGVLLIGGSFSPKAIAIPTDLSPSTPKRLVADLPNILPPPTLPVNPGSTVNVPSLNRPAASKPSSTTSPIVLPTNRTPTFRQPSVQPIPAKISQPETVPSDLTPPVIEFGQPLPKTK